MAKINLKSIAKLLIPAYGSVLGIFAPNRNRPTAQAYNIPEPNTFAKERTFLENLLKNKSASNISTGGAGNSRSQNYTIPEQTTQSQPQTSPTSNFTSELMKILRNAQVQQQAGQAGLMKQQQNITGTGLNMANQINTQDIEQLNPQDIVGLRRGAIGAVQPGELSVENQIKLSNAGFANVNDLVDKTLGSYENEQNRIAEQQYRNAMLAETIRNNRAEEALDWAKQGAGAGAGAGAGGVDAGAAFASDLLNPKGLGKGLRYAVGTGLGRGFLRANPDRVNFINKAEQLLSFLTLNTFAEAKAKGMTFGAMSDAEWDILRAAASPIGNARVLNKNGKVVGYNMSEDAMVSFLNSLSGGGAMEGSEEDNLLSQYGL